MIALLPSMVAAGAIAWWITRREGWPVMAVLLQLSFHFLWSAILVADLEVGDAAAGPLASGLGVATVAFMSLLLRLVRRPPRREEVFGVLTPEPIEQDEESVPKLPRAQVVAASMRRRHSAYRRSAPAEKTRRVP